MRSSTLTILRLKLLKNMQMTISVSLFRMCPIKFFITPHPGRKTISRSLIYKTPKTKAFLVMFKCYLLPNHSQQSTITVLINFRYLKTTCNCHFPLSELDRMNNSNAENNESNDGSNETPYTYTHKRLTVGDVKDAIALASCV